MDHGLNRCFEAAHRRIVVRDRFHVLRKQPPVCKIVSPRNCKLRIGLVERRASHLLVGESLRQPGDVGIEKARVPVRDELDGGGIPVLPGAQQIGRLIPILLE